MSHKGNQNIPENMDKNISLNGEGSDENGVDSKKKEIHDEIIEDATGSKKTRSSKRLNVQKTPEDNIEAKANEVESIIESNIEGTGAPVEPAETDVNEDELITEEFNGSSNIQDEGENPVENSDQSEEKIEESVVKGKEQNTSTEDYILDTETFMEPLVLQPDEPCPELEFEESDKDSEKHSPVLSRCTTRRSQNRKIPTPNTPRSLYEPEPEKEQVDSERGSGSPTAKYECTTKNSIFNETDTSSANASMTVQVGGNDTRTDFSEGESELLQNLRSKGSNSAPRYLSSRRSIRSLRNDVHAKSFRDSMHRSKLYVPSPLARESVERAPSVKRKERSETPEERKKLKSDNSGFLSRLSSPLTNLKYKFTTTPTGTSTPKLTSYKDEKNNIDGDYFDQMEMPEALAEQRNKWCEIM